MLRPLSDESGKICRTLRSLSASDANRLALKYRADVMCDISSDLNASYKQTLHLFPEQPHDLKTRKEDNSVSKIKTSSLLLKITRKYRK